MNLYLVTRHEDDDVDYEEYQSILVAAETEEDARRINPLDATLHDEENDEYLGADHLVRSNARWAELKKIFDATPWSGRTPYASWVNEDYLHSLKVTLLATGAVYDKPYLILTQVRS